MFMNVVRFLVFNGQAYLTENDADFIQNVAILSDRNCFGRPIYI